MNDLAPMLLALWHDWGVTVLVAVAGLAGLLALGRLLGNALGLHLLGIPEALLAGTIGLAVAPTGLVPLVPEPVIALWAELPTALLTLVFACLLLGKPLPNPGGLWRPLSAQVLMALTIAFGQYLVAGLAVLLLLQPWLGVHPLMGVLIEVAYEGGHGSAAAMGPIYADLGFPGGEALGLALSTVGLLAATVVGGLVVVLGRGRGWLLADRQEPMEPGVAAGAAPTPGWAPEPPEPAPPAPHATPFKGPAERWAVNLALTGVAVVVGYSLWASLGWLADQLGGGFKLVIDALPVFPLALAGSLLVRLVLEKTGKGHWTSAPIQSLVSTLAADLLITAATACLDLSLLRHDWLPLTVLAAAGLLWNLGVLLLLAPRILPAPWFERGIVEFGQGTGVAASGLLLLRMSDPADASDALPAFSIKQLILQPLIAGGVITVGAPLAVMNIGLPAWTALCLVLVLIWISLGLWLARRA
ncbi:sodium/glutamate symporter [Cyanobium sp. Morenito 9A2]|uniref:sodium/glutamate symporter n=1 Tax=Cyanobium sp. Morenito 9A2 TaxID=2823718 RepID=UPI0020CC3E2A|nr:sodium/glutamate symporter [Cyanobium sp. Morenito 9A2]MCP9850913.1 sodium:solute symporter [Cyanobium sp. Morenito 9A2]